MMRRASKVETRTRGIDLGALQVAPAQTFGAIRILPILRRDVPMDIRLYTRPNDAKLSVVGLEGERERPKSAYFAYVPHAMILEWGRERGQVIAARGAALAPAAKIERRLDRVQLLHRMAKREAKDRLRFLPLHLAFEGYLSLHFKGPTVAWREYSQEALRSGLSPRVEQVRRGGAIDGLEQALRLFELHEGQVGAMIFVADALAAVHVVPHPEDYRRVHRSLLSDLYGELIYRYGLLYGEVGELQTLPMLAPVTDLAQLGAQVSTRRSEWREISEMLAEGVLARPLRWTDVYDAGPFTLRRFVGDLGQAGDDHIGEAIVRDDGTIEYLKTFRLSAAQSKRAYLLERLAAAEWSLADCAEALKIRREDLIDRLRNAGFGYLLRAHVR